jgi:hypothetical protein
MVSRIDSSVSYAVASRISTRDRASTALQLLILDSD